MLRRTPVGFDPFRGGEVARTAASTEPQREIFTSAAISDLANTSYNLAESLRVAGPIDLVLLETALRTVVDRHDALRMTFTLDGLELCVTEQNDFALERLDWGGSDGSTLDTRLASYWRDLVARPMSLSDGPLFRAIWIQLGEQRGELVLLAHHIVCDGWSFHVIIEEIAELCGGAGAEDLEPAPSFADFAEREQARALSNADADYWTKLFETRPPVLDLPTDGVRPPFRSFAAARVDHAFDASLAKSIGTAAGRLKASVANVVLAGIAALLHRLTGTTDLAVGMPIARQGSEGLPGLVGHAVQLLPIRMAVQPGDSFGDLVERAKSAVLDAREHFDFTFGALVPSLGLSGDPSRVPLVPVLFNFDPPSGEIELGAASATLRSVPRVAESFEMFLNVVPGPDGLALDATFNTGLFAHSTIRQWMAALESLLVDGTASPATPISALNLSRERPPIYAVLNDTVRERSGGSWLDRLAEATAERGADVAVVDSVGALTYAELSRRSNALARTLVERGVAPGSIVGIHLSRSRELVVAVAAVHKAGAAYVPLDPAFPEARLAFMLGDSGARVLISDVALPAAMAAMQLETLMLGSAFSGDSEGSAGESPLPEIHATDLAYVIYTSGSTGTPKGVEVTHGAVANLLASVAKRPGMSRADTLLAVTTLSFDISVLELLAPLTTGGRVIVATREEAGDARKLAALISRHSVTVLQATPSTWRALLTDGWPGSETLTALCGGEPLSPELAAALVGRVKALWNMYGPTETTIWSTCEQIRAHQERITVGRPLDNTVVYVLSDGGQALPPAIAGEICIGGAGVARGYHGRPDLTAERFVEFPAFGRLYRTGDRGRVLESGVIEHLGRLDDQVKVRGFRIELGEIEAVLSEHPDIRQAAVHLWTAKADDVRIVACCVPATAGMLALDSLRQHVRARLPEYMLPQHFLSIDAIPLSPSGKVDRRRLPTPDVADGGTGHSSAIDAGDDSDCAPRTDLEREVASVWSEVLQVKGVNVRRSFFAMGGHSLLGVLAMMKLRERMGVELSLGTLLEAPTVEQLSLKIESLLYFRGKASAADESDTETVEL